MSFNNPLDDLNQEVNDALRMSASIPPPAPPLTESMRANVVMKEEIADVLSIPPHERKAMKEVFKKRQEKEKLASTLLSKTQAKAGKKASSSTGALISESLPHGLGSTRTLLDGTQGTAELGKSLEMDLTKSQTLSLSQKKSSALPAVPPTHEGSHEEVLQQPLEGTSTVITPTFVEENVGDKSRLTATAKNRGGGLGETTRSLEETARSYRELEETFKKTEHQQRLSIEERLAIDDFNQEAAKAMIEKFMAGETPLADIQTKSPWTGGVKGHRYMLEHNILYVIIRDTLTQYPLDAHLRINQFLTEKGYSSQDLVVFRTAWSEVMANHELFGRNKVDPNHKINPSLFAEECLKLIESRVNGLEELSTWTERIQELKHEIEKIQEEDLRERKIYEEKWRYEVDENGEDLQEYPVDVEPTSKKIQSFQQRCQKRYQELLQYRRVLTQIKRSLRAFVNEIYRLPENYLTRTEDDDYEIVEHICKYQDSCSSMKILLDPLPRGQEHGLSFWEMYKHFTPIWHLRLPILYHSYRFGKLKMIRRHATTEESGGDKTGGKGGGSGGNGLGGLALPLYCSTDRILALDIDQEHCQGNEMDAWETYTFLLDFVWLKEFNPFPKPLDAISGDNQDKCNILFLFEYPEHVPFHSMVSAELAILLRKFPDILLLWCIQLALACHGMDYCQGKLFTPFHYTFNLNITNDGLLLFQDLLLLDNIDEEKDIYTNSETLRYFKKDVFLRRRGFDPYRGVVSTSVVGSSNKSRGEGKESKDGKQDQDDNNGGMTKEELDFEELLEEEEKNIKRFMEEHEDDLDADDFDSDEGDDAYVGSNNWDDYQDPDGMDPLKNDYQDKDYDYIERFVCVKDPKKKSDKNGSSSASQKPGNKQKDQDQGDFDEFSNSNTKFEYAKFNAKFPYNFANFVPWVYDILQVATASSRNEILRLQDVSTFHRLGYALKFPQYVFDKKSQAASTSQKKSTDPNNTSTHSAKTGSSGSKSRNEAIQHYVDDEPVALSPYQTYSIVVGGELNVELYCGELNRVSFYDFDKVYGEGQTLTGTRKGTSAEDYLRASLEGTTATDGNGEGEDEDKESATKKLFNGQFDPEDTYHELHVVKRVDQLATYKVDANHANPYLNQRFDGPQVKCRINNRNASALMQSKAPAEPYVAYILNKNGHAMYAPRDINNCQAYRHNLLPRRYNAMFQLTSDVPCVFYLEFAVTIYNPMSPNESQRKTGALKVQFIPNIPATVPEAQDVLVSLEEFHRTKVPTVLFRSHPFLTAKEVWRDDERSKQMIVNGSVAWGKMKKRIQQGQDYLA